MDLYKTQINETNKDLDANCYTKTEINLITKSLQYSDSSAQTDERHQ
jgi:hypothetical protein